MTDYKSENNLETKSREYPYDSQAVAIFSLKSAVVVATVLSIPDAVALIPSVSSITSWILKLVGCWTTALITWFIFCIGLLNLLRIIVIGVILEDNGIKLWRYGKLIPWESIEAVSLEPEYIFTAIFSFDKLVYRFTLYKKPEIVPKLLKLIMVPVYIPSYLFSTRGFEQLVAEIVERKYGLASGNRAYLLFDIDKVEHVRRTYKLVSFQRLLISALIAFGVTTFLARKACVLYAYNEGLREFHRHQYVDAQKSFAFSASLDPTFAPAFHGLAGSQFSMGEFVEARENWKKALKWKPDYVEAKVSLAYLSLQKRNFERADELLNSALRISPYNSAALLNKADLDLRKGRISKAVKFARLVIAREEGRSFKDAYMAKCLLAHARLIEGKPKEALKILDDLPISKDRLHGGENLTYRFIVGSRMYLALGMNHKAERMARLAIKRACNVDTLILMAEVRAKRKEYDSARGLLRRCREIMPNNPWVYVLAAEINLECGHKELAYQNLVHAVNLTPKDANSLARIASLMMDLDKPDTAKNIVKLILHMSEDYPLSEKLKSLIDKPAPLKELFPPEIDTN